jgi:transcriptional regulator of acetoin/glycerol metabolism
MQALQSYGWPGNIRELAIVLERAQVLVEDTLIALDDLPEAMQVAPPPEQGFTSETLNLSDLEHRAVQAALQQVQGNKVHAAKLLGITRHAVHRLVTKYGLEGKHGEGGAGSK